MTIKALQFNISDSSLRSPPSNPISGASPNFDRQRTLTRPSMEWIVQRCSQIWKIVRWEASKMMYDDYGLGGAIKVLTKAELITGHNFFWRLWGFKISTWMFTKTPSLTKHEIIIDIKYQDCSRAFLDLIADGLSPETVPNVRSWLVWSQRSQWGPWLRKCFSSKKWVSGRVFLWRPVSDYHR